MVKLLMALPLVNLSPANRPSPSLGAADRAPGPFTMVCSSGFGRRGLLTWILAAATVPEASGSRNELIQEYLRRSKENKAKNDKERLDDYNKRNYKDYFEFIEGSVKDKEELTDSERAILEWLQKNRK